MRTARGWNLTLTVGLLVVVFAVGPALARPGDPDREFGRDGSVVVPVSFRRPHLTIDDRNRVLIAGTVSTGSGSEIVVVRLTSTGQRDSSFGDNGITTLPLPPDSYSVGGLMVDQDEGPIVLGASSPGPIVVKLRSDGMLDTTYFANGVLALDLPDNMVGEAKLFDNDNRIIVGGSMDNGRVGDFDETLFDQALARFLPDGSPDTSFSGDGVVATVVAESAGADHIALDSAGNIVVADRAVHFNLDVFAITRYRPNGILDQAFGEDGIVERGGFLAPEGPNDVAVDALDRVLVTGTAPLEESEFDSPIVMATGRLTPYGFDATFAADGLALLSLGETTVGMSLTPDANGNVVVVGQVRSLGDPADLVAVVRYRVDGTLDRVFGGDGIKTASGNGAVFLDPSSSDLGLDSEGRIVVVSPWVDDGDHVVTVHRFVGSFEVVDAFTDDDDSIFAGDIDWIAALGITTGCTPTLFCPDVPVTRGQMAAFLARALDLEVTGGDRFSDDDTSIFEADIQAIANAGITTGCTPTLFCPNDSVTRGQMAAFLHRALSS